MNKSGKTILKISLIVLPMLFLCSISLANEIDNLPEEYTQEYNSMYKYNALENEVNFFRIENEGIVVVRENIADEDNIKKLENITDKQIDSIGKSDQAMSAIESRTPMRTFLLGNSLGVLRFQVVQIKDQATSIEALASDTGYAENKIQIESQVRLLKEKQEKVENFIHKKENEFSLFGWLVSSL